MKITIKTLKRIIREAVMSEDKFSRTVNRIMTPEEAEERAREMGLDEALVAWLKKDFAEIHSRRDERERNSRDFDEESGIGENGRAAFGRSWESQAEQLAEAMGLEPDAGLYGENPEFERVWNAFYEE